MDLLDSDMRELIKIIEDMSPLEFMKIIEVMAPLASLDGVIDTSLLKSIPQQPQVQSSLNGQLRALQVLAVKFGLYDAADYLRKQLDK